MNLLKVENLRCHLSQPGGRVARAVDGVDLTLGQGEALGVVGESGSGKTVLALALLGLLPGGRESIKPGSAVRWKGEELVGALPGRLRRVRGGEVAMVFQEPMTSLNPVLTMGDQIREALRTHRGLTGKGAAEEAVRLLREVGIPEPALRAGSYPHHLSGGMRQRGMIAMALAGNPELLVADEPTTALDVTVQAQILDLLKGLRGERGMALLLISHDLRVVARVCERVMVMYGGRVVEEGPTEEILSHPAHPYTRGLLDSRLSIRDRRGALRPIPGDVPEAAAWPPGCRFHPRCPHVADRCRRREPDLVEVGGGGWRGRCWFPAGAQP